LGFRVQGLEVEAPGGLEVEGPGGGFRVRGQGVRCKV